MIRHFFVCCIAAISLLAATSASAQVATSGPYWPGPVVSGSWYDPARSGEGLILQYLPNGKALGSVRTNCLQHLIAKPIRMD